MSLTYSLELRDQILSQLRTFDPSSYFPHPAIVFGFVFGSFSPRSKCPPHQESDLDIAVFIDPWPSEPDFRNQFCDQVETLTGRTTDLILLNNADPIICAQIIETGSPLWIRDHNFYLQFISKNWLLYLDFKMNRAIAEKTLLKKGWPQWEQKT